MSVTINIVGKKAALADGQWRSADETLRELLNNHLATLELPGHYPPADRERLAARAVVRELGARIIDYRPIPDDPSRMPDGRLVVY